LKAGETNEFQMISGEVVSQIADRFRKISKPTLPKSKIHSRPDVETPEESTLKTDTELPKKKPGTSVPRKAVPKVEIPSIDIPPQREEARSVQPRVAAPEQPPARPFLPQREPMHAETAAEEVITQQPSPAAPIQPQWEETRAVRPRVAMPEQPLAAPIPPQWEAPRPVPPRVIVPEQPPARPVPPQREPMHAETAAEEVITQQPFPAVPIQPQWEETRPVRSRVTVPEPPPAALIPPQMEETRVETKSVPLAKPAVNYVPIQGGVPLAKPSATNIPIRREESKPVEPRVVIPKESSSARPIAPQMEEARPVVAKQKETNEQPAQVEKEVYEEVLIGQQKIKLSIPAHVIRQAQLASSENKNKLAGYWSAQIIKVNPHIMKSSLSDPVAIWFEVKNVILKKFNKS
jgi:hypothetical protein